MTSGDGGGEASRCGLDGVSSTASGVGVQGFLPAGVAAAGTAVAVEGSWAELAPKVEAALPRRRRRRGFTAVAALEIDDGRLQDGRVQETVAIWRPATRLKITRAFKPLAQQHSYSA
jgi:hypothetical protein